MEIITGPNISGADWYPDLAEAMVPMWEAIGIDVQLTIMPYGNLLSEIRNLETSDFGTEQRVRAYGYRYGTRPDMGLLYNGINRYLPAGGGLTLYSDPFLWDWLQTWQKSIDPIERTIMEQGYGDYAYDNYTHIPLFWVNPQAVINPKVVVDYVANHKNFGPVRRLEFIEGVRE
jgi:ABC-type transport system substrate-binding protein